MGRLHTPRTDATAAMALMTINEQAHCAADANENTRAGRQGAPNTNAATSENAGESAQPRRSPHASATVPTSAHSMASTAATPRGSRPTIR